MKQYIPKAAVVAEIERRIKQFVNEINTLLKNSDNTKELRSRIIMCKEVLSFINTLEVKEVDLEKEIEKCLKRHSMLAVGKKDFTDIAKHFFELGLKVQKL